MYLYTSYDFNPRSRKGFDVLFLVIKFVFHISIHEAAKASTHLQTGFYSGQIFQSTKPQRLRLPVIDVLHKRLIFQSTKPQRLRHVIVQYLEDLQTFQSTKPQRLRLSIRQTDTTLYGIFQSTKPQRLRLLSGIICLIPFQFQSTKPQRLRRYRLGQGTQKNYFNPRSRKGFDINWQSMLPSYTQFQSTKPQRLRQSVYTLDSLSEVFQSTKPQRLRHNPTTGLRDHVISIHEAAKASTMLDTYSFVRKLISIHEAAKASTPSCVLFIICLIISIHEAAKASTNVVIRDCDIARISIHEAAKASTTKLSLLCQRY